MGRQVGGITGDYPAAVAHRLKQPVHAIKFTPARIGQTLHVFCDKGKHTVDWHIGANQHPDRVAKHMLQKGWRIGTRLVCPDCAKAKKSPVERVRKSVQETLGKQGIMTRVEEARDGHIDVFVLPKPHIFADPPKISKGTILMENRGSTAIGVAQVETQRALKLAIRKWLMEAYDEHKNCYRENFSDATIAKETGASPDFVKSIREEDYGEMGEPAEIRLLRAELEGYVTQAKQIADKAATDLAGLARKVDAMNSRLDRACQKNGWKLPE